MYLVILVGVFIIVTFLFLYSQKEMRTDSFEGLILFSSVVNTDIENLLNSCFHKQGRDLSYKKGESILEIKQGKNWMFLDFHNEIIPEDFVDILISSFPGLNYEEIELIRNHQGFIGIRTLVNSKKSKDRALLVLQVLLALLKQESAIGYINTTVAKYYPVRHFAKYLTESVLRPEELYFLFDKAQKEVTHG